MVYYCSNHINPRILNWDPKDLLSPLRGGAVVGEQGLQSAAMRALDLDISGQNIWYN